MRSSVGFWKWRMAANKEAGIAQRAWSLELGAWSLELGAWKQFRHRNGINSGVEQLVNMEILKGSFRESQMFK